MSITVLDASAAVPVRLSLTIEQHVQRLWQGAFGEQNIPSLHLGQITGSGHILERRAVQLIEAWHRSKHRRDRLHGVPSSSTVCLDMRPYRDDCQFRVIPPQGRGDRMRDLAPPFHCELHTSLPAFPPWLQQAVSRHDRAVAAIGRGTLPLRMAGTSPAMTVENDTKANRVCVRARAGISKIIWRTERDHPLSSPLGQYVASVAPASCRSTSTARAG